MPSRSLHFSGRKKQKSGAGVKGKRGVDWLRAVGGDDGENSQSQECSLENDDMALLECPPTMDIRGGSDQSEEETRETEGTSSVKSPGGE